MQNSSFGSITPISPLQVHAWFDTPAIDELTRNLNKLQLRHPASKKTIDNNIFRYRWKAKIQIIWGIVTQFSFCEVLQKDKLIGYKRGFQFYKHKT